MKLYRSPKAWAIEAGYPVKEGKGRMPKNVSEEWQRLLRAGEVGLEATAPVKPPRTDSTPKGTQSVKPKTAGKEVLETAPARYPDTARVFARIDGKKVYGTLRAACYHSGLSLQWCPCPSHKAIVSNSSGYVPVTVETPDE